MTIYDIAAAVMFFLFLAAGLRGMRWAAKPAPDTDPPQEWLLSWLDHADDVAPDAEPTWFDLPHQSRHGAEIAELEAMWRR